MHAEEVDIEGRCEGDLLDDDFGEDGEEFGGEVEVVVDEHEPRLIECQFSGFLKASLALLPGSNQATHHL